MDRTFVLKLHPTPEQVHALQQHTACFNTVASHGFSQKRRSGVELYKHTSYDLRARYADLPARAGLVGAARVKATEAVKSALDRQYKERKTSVSHSCLCPIRSTINVHPG